MPHSFGYRARTRDMFKRGFKEHGPIKLSTYLINYRVGDIVDIKANAAQQKGMPHKYYHGRTGIVYNVTPHAVGVIVYKVVGNRYIEKRVNIRVEHIRHSKCRQEFLDRVKRNHEAHVAAKETGERISLKRVHALPREAHTVSIADNAPQTMAPVAYETTI
ncbi:ribosomal protein L21e-domain-containing protein [Boletus reticuloceps]|uniref:Ribosomal protein L21e-domain-containing protein n=1 Tax=Boletus reticuloceps TaxID=495285 RepID=A0A8I2YWL1_9AGAM|nr:ribosomal protein L21e-domain-containing protein [Boletus reticuloceps]